MSGDDHASTAEGQGDAASSASGYQPRQQGYQPYQRREGGYQPYQRREGGYQPRNNGYNRQNADQQGQGGYQPRQNHNGYGQPRQNQGYGNYNRQNNHNNGYGQQRQQGGYQPRQQGGYGQNQQGGYQPRQQGGYGQNQQGGYQPRQNQGGYQPRQQGGYGQRQQGGYQPRQNQGGYGQQRQQGGYQPRQNQGGYQQRGQQRPNQRGGYNQNRMNQPSRTFTPRPRQIEYQIEEIDPNAEIRLNKYMANAGICSRREADEHITNGKVKVNGNVVTELGVKITPKDVVEFDDKVVTPERKCYVLLNKPKDCVTTSDDPNGRLTVLDLVKNACRERIYPVGRLDRNTTGVLLLTNDGDLASKLTHPKFVKKKIYHVWTDKEIAEEDMQRIADGIELEDGEIHADAISYVADARNQAGIEIHSGRNRIVRRIFEHLGYRVTKLDRVYFAGLTKKNLPRGRWRYLTQEEVNFLRMGSFE
ncbi:MAG: rRNA pseudouridine synthase [Muribaculaceae bacterium]|nr:rRNA pseudouridine synthase [Muribaculaceae bacterium]